MIIKKSCLCNVKKNPGIVPLFFLFFGICFFPFRAHAYLDPGTGSYVVQILIGTVLGAGYIIGNYWRKILDFLHINRNGVAKSKKGTKK